MINNISKFEFFMGDIRKLKAEDYKRVELIYKDYSLRRLLKVWLRMEGLFGCELSFAEFTNLIEKMNLEEMSTSDGII